MKYFNRACPKDAEVQKFEDLDNPGKWTKTMYLPQVKGKKNMTYDGYKMPTGAVPLPVDPVTGERSGSGHKLYYTKEELSKVKFTSVRGDDPSRPFGSEVDKSRAPVLNKQVLQRLGL